MLNANELIGFGVGGQATTPVTYGYVGYGGAGTVFTLPAGTMGVVIVTELLTNGWRNWYTNSMLANGVPAQLVMRSRTPQEYDQDISIFIANNLTSSTLTLSGFAPYTPGIVGVYAFDKNVPMPDHTAQAHYSSLNLSIPVYKDGIVIAGYGTFNGTPYISAPFVRHYQYGNPSYCSASFIPTTTQTLGVSAGPVSQYYGQNLAVVSWKPETLNGS